jgi:hypothetical protein
VNTGAQGSMWSCPFRKGADELQGGIGGTLEREYVSPSDMVAELDVMVGVFGFPKARYP